MKKLYNILTIASALFLALPFFALAAPTAWDRYIIGGIKPLVTTDNVLIGASATTSNQQLEVIGGGYFSTNLGIATTTPSHAVSIFSTTAPQLSLSAGAGIAQWTMRNAGANLYFATTTVAGTATSSTPALSILGSSGYVGIGTANPTYALNVVGQTNNATALFYNPTAGINTQVVIRTSVPTDGGTTNSPFIVKNSSGTVVSAIREDGVMYAQNLSTMDNATAALGQPGSIGLGQNIAGLDLRNTASIGWSNSTAYWNQVDTVLSRVSAGVVGVGTTAQGSTNGTLVAGNIGVGTSTPSYSLTSYSATAPQLSLSAGAGINQWAFRNAGGDFHLSSTTVAGNSTTTVPALSILTSSGNVGIGIASPTAKLYVDNTGGAGVGLAVRGTSGQDILQVIAFDGSIKSRFSSSGDMYNWVRMYNPYIDLYQNITLSSGMNFGWTASCSTCTQDTAVSRIGVAKMAVGNGTNGNSTGTLVAGNIGIGTTTPYTALGVSGTIVADSIYATSTTATSYFAGNVGIGITPATYPLHIAGSNASPTTFAFIHNTNGSVGAGPALGFGTFSAGNTTVTERISAIRTNLVSSGDGDMVFSTYGSGSLTEKVRILSNGNVGIGTTTPTAKLAVTGGDLNVGDYSNANNNNIVMYGKHGSANVETNYLGFVNGYTPTQLAAKISFLRGGDALDGQLALFTRGAGVLSEKMRIDVGGNVGIGTTTPAKILHLSTNNNGIRISMSAEPLNYFTDITQNYTNSANAVQFAINTTQGGSNNGNVFAVVKNSAGSSNDTLVNGLSKLRLQTAGTDRVTIDSTGNVGIGTTTPASLLHLGSDAGTAAGGIKFGSDTNLYRSTVNTLQTDSNFVINGSNAWYQTGALYSTKVYLLTGLTTNGAVDLGLGTNGATSALTVLNSNSYVGIGTTTPSARLNVGGSIVSDEVPVSFSATPTFDWATSNQLQMTLTSNVTSMTFSNGIRGGAYRLVLCQDGTGSRTVAFASNILWAGGTAPTMTATANKCDIFTFTASFATTTAVKYLGGYVQNF